LKAALPNHLNSTAIKSEAINDSFACVLWVLGRCKQTEVGGSLISVVLKVGFVLSLISFALIFHSTIRMKKKPLSGKVYLGLVCSRASHSFHLGSSLPCAVSPHYRYTPLGFAEADAAYFSAAVTAVRSNR